MTREKGPSKSAHIHLPCRRAMPPSRKTPSSVPPALESRIITVRGHRVLLDADLAEVYQVSPAAFNHAVNRNAARFPANFAFHLNEEEKNEVVTNHDHLARLKSSHALPMAFTEHGALMAATFLNSDSAIKVSVTVIEAFARLRHRALHVGLAIHLAEERRRLEGRYGDLQNLSTGLFQLIDAQSPSTPKLYSIPSAESAAPSTDHLGAQVTPASMDFGGMFEVKVNPDGTWTAELGWKTKDRFQALFLKQNPADFKLLVTLLNLPSNVRETAVPIPLPAERDPSGVPPIILPKGVSEDIHLLRRTNIYEIFDAAQINTQKFHRQRKAHYELVSALGVDLTVLKGTWASPALRRKALKRLKRQYENVLEGMMLGGKKSPHARSSTVNCPMEDGSNEQVLLSWLLLVHAPGLLEHTRELPSKKELRDHIEALYPNAKYAGSTWSAAIDNAGLKSLPRESKW